MKKQFDRDLAGWMRRAGLPVDVIGASLGVSGQAIGKATRARPETLRLAWCRPEFRGDFLTLRSKVGPEAARLLVERDLMKVRR
jgi:hypothetical protein